MRDETSIRESNTRRENGCARAKRCWQCEEARLLAATVCLAWCLISQLASLTPVGRGTQMGSIEKAKRQCSIAHASANEGLALLCGREWFRKTIGQ